MKLLSSFTLAITCLAVFSNASCKAKQQINNVQPLTDTLKPFVLKYERGPCFGQCPVYVFYLLNDHTGLIHVKANMMDSAGWYFTNPDQEAIVEILELIEPPEWWAPSFRNEPEIADLPTTALVYHHPQGTRMIAIQKNTNNELEKVFDQLNHIVTESQWSPALLRPLDPENNRTDLIVQLKPGVDINSWMRKFESFGITLKKRIAPRQQYYLVTKDPSKGHPNDFLQSIKADPDVIDAQWDKSVEMRN